MPGPKRGFTTPHTYATVILQQEINLWKETENLERNCRKKYQAFKLPLMITFI